MVRRILKIGSSAAITVPLKSLSELGLKVGDRVIVEINKETKTLVIKPVVKVEKELFEWTKKFINKYRPTLEELAKK